MFVTIVIVSIFIGLVVVQAVLWAVFLRWGLRWAKVENVTMRRVGAAAVLALVFRQRSGSVFVSSHPSTRSKHCS